MEIKNLQTDTDSFIQPVIASVDSRPPVHPARVNNVTCGECGNRFATSVVTERTPGAGELWHFLCPHCGHRYNVCRITRQGVELRRQLDSIKAQLRLAPHNAALAAQRDDLLARLAAEITDLTKHPRPESPSSA